MSVYENMASGLKLRKLPKEEIRRRVNEAAGILGITDYLERKPKTLSGGQRQRVAVGRAIVRQPSVFLFDEPLSNLDATMIYVTHDKVEAMTMGQRIIVMKDGVVQQVAEPLEIYNNPANLFVAGFLGSPPMNFLQGTIRPEGNAHVFFESGGTIAIHLSGRSNLGACAGKNITLGVRPENCALLAQNVPQGPNQFKAVVDIVEPMGAETFLYLKTASPSLVSRIHNTVKRAETGHLLRFQIEPSRGHLFDSRSGERIV